jgi:NAD(P)-dependent dehydrogenase (short-subunit alcohol dehydrogenase family)
MSSGIALRGKVALVTGGASGIGRAIAMACAQEGARLVLGDLNVAAGEALVAELQHQGAEGLFVRTDVSNPEDATALVQAGVERYGRLDVAFNNAGIADGPVPSGSVEYPLELWHRMLAINLNGVFFGMRAQIPALLASGGGAIVNTASIAGLVAFPNCPAYVASKHGVVGLTKTIALEYGRRGIRCNAIAPGIVETPMSQPALSDEATRKLFTAPIPLGRTAAAEEIAQAAVWLASPGASYLNGAILPVDGGLVAQ